MPYRSSVVAACLLLAVPAPVPLPVAAAMVAGAETTLVVDLGDGPAVGPAAVTVTSDGSRRAARLEPVVADGLAVTLVVDASAAGGETLPAWLSAAARFILSVPSGTRSVVIADRAPAAAVTPPQRGAYGVVRALNTVRAGGERDTATALELASGQFPEVAAGRRVVLLYTTAADAGGPGASRLAADYRARGTLLVVVGSAAAARYWTAAAGGTGGFFAPAGDPVVVPALDQVETTLSGRHLVRFPTPPDLPAPVEVRVETEELAFTGEAVVESPTGSPGLAWGWLITIAGALILLLGGLVIFVRARRASRPSPPLSGPLGSPEAPVSSAVDDVPLGPPPAVGDFRAGPRSANPMSPPAVGRAPVHPAE
ncbi:hypothetical protein AB0M02_14900 [Actinoplanes sp. NPDC051861]|uniref:hypothetical protein n=1 Tax=Actinoplanes sp. NPDC051861 TaxID=3155170 RepID=UPI00343CAD33